MSETLAPHIDATPDVCGGQPRVSGKRFTVQQVYVLHKILRMTPEEIVNDYDLTLAEVFAALAYAFDHQMEIEEGIGKENAFVEEFKRSHPSKLGAMIGEEAVRFYLDEPSSSKVAGTKNP